MSAATQAEAAPPQAARRTTFRTRLLILGATILQHLPEGPLHRIAYALGGVLYRVKPARRRLVRANLERVVTWLETRTTSPPASQRRLSTACMPSLAITPSFVRQRCTIPPGSRDTARGPDPC